MDVTPACSKSWSCQKKPIKEKIRPFCVFSYFLLVNIVVIAMLLCFQFIIVAYAVMQAAPSCNSLWIRCNNLFLLHFSGICATTTWESSHLKLTKLEQELPQACQQVWQFYPLLSAVLLSFCHSNVNAQDIVLMFLKIFFLLEHIHFKLRRPIPFKEQKWYFNFFFFPFRFFMDCEPGFGKLITELVSVKTLESYS